MAKIALLLKEKNVEKLLVFADNIHTKMVAEAAVFPQPSVTMADFRAHIDHLSQSQQATIGAGKTARAIRDAALKQLQDDLRRLANYVENISLGDENIIRSAGFQVVRRGPRQYSTIDVPLSFTAVESGIGSVLLRWGKVANARNYQVQLCKDLVTEEGWQNAMLTTKTSLKVPGLTAGSKYFFRVCTVGRDTLRSEWSEIIVIHVR